MSGAVCIRACAGIEEAVVVCSLLRSGGFEASIDNYYHATWDWFKVHAFGGVYVSVPASQVEDAAHFMLIASAGAELSLRKEFEHANDWEARRPIAKAWTMPFLEFGGLYVVAYFVFILLTLLPERTLADFQSSVVDLRIDPVPLDYLDVIIYLVAMFGGYSLLFALFSTLAHLHVRKLKRRKTQL